MDEIRQDVAERQLDVLAGRVAELERKVRELLEALRQPNVLERTGMEGYHIKDIERAGIGDLTAEVRHHNERKKAVKEAEKDLIFQRLRSNPGLAFPVERQKLAELDAAAPTLAPPLPGRATRKRKGSLSNSKKRAS